MLSQLNPALRVFILLTVVTGCAYPALVTMLAQGLFPDTANGSLIVRDGRTVGSALIGQHFSAERYFWGRLSATGPFPYNGALSSGSNLGPLNPALTAAAQGRIDALRKGVGFIFCSDGDPGCTERSERPVNKPDTFTSPPIDLVTASGSGLDPHISLAAAHYQAARVAAARGQAPDAVLALIERHAEPRRLGFWGEPRVNVLRLNLALDDAQ